MPRTAANGTITVEEAVSRALKFLTALDRAHDFQNVRVEEVERSGSHWLITLGFSTGLVLPLATGPREYKVFKVNGQNGEVESMKIRVVK